MGDGQGDIAPGDGPEWIGLGERLERAEGEAVQLRRQVADLRERVGKAEGEANAVRDSNADLRSRLDRAEAQLADARTPWWRRLFPST
jgi:uncharacterized membrane protein